MKFSQAPERPILKSQPPKPTIKLVLPVAGADGPQSPRAAQSTADVFQYAVKNIAACTSYEWVNEHKLCAGKFSGASFASFFIATLHEIGAIVAVGRWTTIDLLLSLDYGIKHFIKPRSKTAPAQLLRQRINKAFKDKQWGAHLTEFVHVGEDEAGKVTYALKWHEAEGKELAPGAARARGFAALAEAPKPRFEIVGDRMVICALPRTNGPR